MGASHSRSSNLTSATIQGHWEASMIAVPLLAAMLLAAPQDSPSGVTARDPEPAPAAQITTPLHPKWTPEQLEEMKQKAEQARIAREPVRKRAVHINDMAGNIHSEADARALVDAVAEELSGHRHLLWTALSIRHRVAHAEWEAISDPSGLVPEQRIVDVWNEYVREIDAPEETLVTVAELHNMRDSTYAGLSRYWTFPC